MASNSALMSEIGPYGLPREAPIIAYTEKVHSNSSLLSLLFRVIALVKMRWRICIYFILPWRQIIEEERLQLKKYVHNFHLSFFLLPELYFCKVNLAYTDDYVRCWILIQCRKRRIREIDRYLMNCYL